MNLKNIGFNDYVEAQFNSIGNTNDKIARISGEYEKIYKIITEYGEKTAEISGNMKYNAKGRFDYPAVGDWVIVKGRKNSDKYIIKKIVPRKTKVSRKVAGKKSEEQIISANMDYIFIMSGLKSDYNVNRLERYLTIAWDSGAKPVIILNKADLCNLNEIEKKKNKIAEIAFGVPVHVISCKENRGLEEINKYLSSGITISLLGSSGVGKSTLINLLIGKTKQKTNNTRYSDGKGKHTTTSREIIIIPDKGVIIDTPGMREIQLWNNESGISSTFADIEKLSKGCKFNDCTHTHEPDCAVKKAIEDGDLNKERLNNFHKMKREMRYQKIKEMKSA
ncbi:MAG: ribosome small subunit-dependent GTPase A, partial [Bacillota bacterium]